MATKSKNRLLLIGFFLLLSFGIGGLYSFSSWADFYVKKNYFQTDQFQYEARSYLELVNEFELNYKDKETKKKEITVTSDEITEHRTRYGDLGTQISTIRGQYEKKIQNAASVSVEAADVYTKERDAKIADITENFKDDAYVREKIVKEKEKEIDKQEKERVASRRDTYTSLSRAFKFYFRDLETNEVHTNISVKDMNEAKAVLMREEPLWVEKYSDLHRLGFSENKHVEGILAVPTWGDASVSFRERQLEYDKNQKMFFIYMTVVLLVWVGIVYVGYTKRAQLVAIGKQFTVSWPLDLQILALLFSIFFAWAFTLEVQFPFYRYGHGPVSYIRFVTNWIISVGTLTFVTVLTLSLWKMVQSLPQKKVVQNTLTAKLWNLSKEIFYIRSVSVKVLLALFTMSLLTLAPIFIIISHFDPFMTLFCLAILVCGGLFVSVYTLRNLYNYQKIIRHIRKKNNGDIVIKGKNTLAEIGRYINDLTHNTSSLQKEQMKSERLKTELITNVSHDLRTPLTSIITYTDLLKRTDVTEDERKSYIEIIDRKSKRLQVLIEDLFEASKMASGNMELVRERVDLVQLLQQALGEHDEAIRQSELQFRVTHDDSQLYARVDGQKIWRVFDNLIQNILRYSMPHSRVYITAQQQGDDVVLFFKNISKYELGHNTDELLERFKRGDTSRHTEGSGLGLAIAKSIVDLHGGQFTLSLDGDLFTVHICLPIS